MKMSICLARLMALIMLPMFFTKNIPANVIDNTEKNVAIENVSAVEITDTIIPGDQGEEADLENVNKANIMKISCEHCHENFAADINKNSAICTHCGHYNDFAG